jgi:hypothetical protein
VVGIINNFIGGYILPEKNNKMVTRKYLTVNIVGHTPIKAWFNKEKTETNKQPDYKGDGVAVWVNTYEEKPKTEEKLVVEEKVVL